MQARLAAADGRIAQAENAFRALLAAVPEEGSFRIIRQMVYLHVGRLFFNQGEFSPARDHWEVVWGSESTDYLVNIRRRQAMVGIAESWFAAGAGSGDE